MEIAMVQYLQKIAGALNLAVGDSRARIRVGAAIRALCGVDHDRPWKDLHRGWVWGTVLPCRRTHLPDDVAAAVSLGCATP
jgi:hypothetical protein